MVRKSRYKLYNENRFKAIFTSFKEKLFKNNRGFNKLRKGSKNNEPVIGSQVPRSFK